MNNNNNIPIEITSYDVQSPDGAVTQVTEMLYDVANNPFRQPFPTIPPSLPSSPPPPPPPPILTHPLTPVIPTFLSPVVTPTLIPITTDPSIITRHMTTHFRNTGGNSYGPELTSLPPSSSSSPSSQAINTAMSAKYNSFTTTTRQPTTTPTKQILWSRQIEPITMVWTIEPTVTTTTRPPPTTTTITTSLPIELASEYNTRRLRKKMKTSTTHRPIPIYNKSSSRGSQSGGGLSGAAIAGIVIGSMVSIVLLAGASLFVMYRKPFRPSISHIISATPPPPPVPVPVPPPGSSGSPTNEPNLHTSRV
ncbi:mucin-2-like [Oppia nitens]|uniref:mucin-2-like n=1 Tax=Oppia nitens TaxID=1686743 RepID=UPI0023DAB255|nr:mucin-2-like [Oppia nitens]